MLAVLGATKENHLNLILVYDVTDGAIYRRETFKI